MDRNNESYGKNNKKSLLIALMFLVLLSAWLAWGNLTVKNTKAEITDTNIPKQFNGYKIALISDLHNAEFGKNNSAVLKILKKEKPDIIAITGDIADSRHTDINISVQLAKAAAEEAPCYYVTGNHEAWLGNRYNILEKELSDAGINILHNESKEIKRNNSSLLLAGIDDPSFTENDLYVDLSASTAADNIDKALKDKGRKYTILLSHRPEIFNVYAEKKINLVLSGHSHGGQFRLPFIGGIVAPDQGFFPEYDGGVFTKDGTTMIVSRGLGNSIIPVRINNRPEIVIITLRKK